MQDNKFFIWQRDNSKL